MPLTAVYNFEIRFVETVARSKLRELERTQINHLLWKPAGFHIPVEFALAIYYLEGMGRENEYFSYTGEDCLDVFVKNLDEILSDFANFESEMEMEMTDDEKRKYE